MTQAATPTISIITATYNAAAVLPRLVESLIAQTDQDFEWVVADGASTDGTLEILEQAKTRLKNVVVDSRPDFGIYDAMNRAIKLSKSSYYLIVGADNSTQATQESARANPCRRAGTNGGLCRPLRCGRSLSDPLRPTPRQKLG